MIYSKVKFLRFFQYLTRCLNRILKLFLVQIIQEMERDCWRWSHPCRCSWHGVRLVWFVIDSWLKCWLLALVSCLNEITEPAFIFLEEAKPLVWHSLPEFPCLQVASLWEASTQAHSVFPLTAFIWSTSDCDSSCSVYWSPQCKYYISLSTGLEFGE